MTKDRIVLKNPQPKSKPNDKNFTRKENHEFYKNNFEKHVNSNQEYAQLHSDVRRLNKELSNDKYNKELLHSYSTAIRFRYSTYYLYSRANAFKWLRKPTFRLNKEILPLLPLITSNGMLLYLFYNFCDYCEENTIYYDFMTEMVLQKLFDLSTGQISRAMSNLKELKIISVITKDLPGIKKSALIEFLHYDTEKTKNIPYITIPKQLLLYFNRFKNKSALKLYIYTCFQIDYKKGFHYRSVDTMAKDLKVGHYTISKWLKDLTMNNLIKRFQMSYNTPSMTHLLPLPKVLYDTKFFQEKKQELEDKLKKKQHNSTSD